MKLYNLNNEGFYAIRWEGDIKIIPNLIVHKSHIQRLKDSIYVVWEYEDGDVRRVNSFVAAPGDYVIRIDNNYIVIQGDQVNADGSDLKWRVEE